MHLLCTTNNKVATVLEDFLGTVKKNDLPLRVWGDMGVENAGITWYMFTYPQSGLIMEVSLVEKVSTMKGSKDSG